MEIMLGTSRRRTFRFLRATAAALVAAALLGACEAAPTGPPGRPIPGEYVVMFKGNVPDQDVERLAGEIAAHHRGRVLKSYVPVLRGVLMWLPEPAWVAVSQIRARPDVDHVTQNCYCIIVAH